jgi:DNA-binding response OmpR family regulator
MTATIKAAISPFAQAKTEFDSNPMHFLNEDLASVPVSGIPEEFRKLWRFLPVIVLVPKSVVHEKTAQKKPGPNKSVTGLIDTSDVCLALDAAKAWLRNPNAIDTFEFGGVTGCFSTMEIHRNGRPIILTFKEFKTLAYLIKNPRRVIGLFPSNCIHRNQQRCAVLKIVEVIRVPPPPVLERNGAPCLEYKHARTDVIC